MKKKIRAWQIIVAVPFVLFALLMLFIGGISNFVDGEIGSGIVGVVLSVLIAAPAAAVIVIPLFIKPRQKATPKPQQTPPAEPIAPQPPAAEESNEIVMPWNFGQHERQADLEQLQPTVSSIDPGNPIYGKRICFTGNMNRMDRMEAYQYVVDRGGIPSNSVTKKTSFLVIGEDEYFADHPGYKTTKMKKADEWRERGERIVNISEADFFAMIEQYESRGEKT